MAYPIFCPRPFFSEIRGEELKISELASLTCEHGCSRKKETARIPQFYESLHWLLAILVTTAVFNLKKNRKTKLIASLIFTCFLSQSRMAFYAYHMRYKNREGSLFVINRERSVDISKEHTDSFHTVYFILIVTDTIELFKNGKSVAKRCHKFYGKKDLPLTLGIFQQFRLMLSLYRWYESEAVRCHPLFKVT